MANVEVTDDYMTKIQRLIVILRRFQTRTEVPGDFTEALQIVTYLRQLLQEIRSQHTTRLINRILRRWNQANGKIWVSDNLHQFKDF